MMADSIVLNEVFSENNLKNDELQTINTNADPIEPNEAFPENNLNLDEPLTKTTDNLVELNKVLSESNLIVDESQTISTKNDSVELNGVSSESILNNSEPQENTTNKSQKLDEVFSENNLKSDELQTLNTTTDPIELNEVFPEKNLNLDEPLTKTTDNLVELNKVFSKSNLIVDESQTISSKDDSVELNGVSSESILNNDDPQKNTTNNSLELDEVLSKSNLNIDKPQTISSKDDSVELNEVFPKSDLNDDEPQTINETDNPEALNKLFPKSNLNVTEQQIATTSISNTDENHELTEISNLSSNDTENTQTPHCDQDSVSEMETDSLLEISSSSKKKDYEIGDIVWAKIGRYPFWPSIVCPYPESQTYIRVKKFMLHVRFCNDKGRRSWARVIENYFGKDGLISKYPNCLSSIKNSKNLFNTWNLAVEEADRLSKLDRETRLREFYNIYLSSDDNLDSLNLSLNNSFEGVSNSASKVRTYSRKRSLTVPEQDNAFKIIKSINMSVNGSTSSKSIDIPVLSKSDDADSTVSDISMNYAFIEDNEGSKMKKIIKKRRSTKTYPPKSSFTDKYNVSDLMETSPEYNDDNILSINHEELTDTPMTSTSRMVSVQRKLEVSTLEGDCDQEDLSYSNSRRSSKKIIPKSSSSSKKSISKKPQLRKSTVKSESSPEPDTTESETSSKNETHSSIFLASSKDKQLFIKNFKRACVVCKNIEDTVKCMGSCQSYFHVECLAKSEERYHKNVPKINIKNKKTRSKKRNSKSSLKNKESVPQIIDNIDEADTNKLYEKDDSVVSKSLNGFKTLPKEEYLDHCNAESKVQDQSKSDDNLNEEHKSPNIPESNDLPTNGNCNTMKDENLQDDKKLLNVDKDSMKEKCIENTVETPIKPINSSTISEKMSKDSLKYLCSLCKMEKTNCSDCGLDIEDPGQKIVCKISNCGKYYHEKCLRDWPQCQWLQGLRNNVRCVICPHHVCHLCISDNPKISCTTHCPPEKLTRCIKCPTAYHRSEYCLPAGSQVLTYSDIICSRHFEPTNLQIYHHNANWCFICTLGGPLVFCDLCPSSFHIECLNQNPSEFENGFICEECQTGRYPLYGEIVWVKIGNYRWWPAQIVFPNQVPCSLNAVPHSAGQFAVLFFGTHDYYWVNRGRVFSFQEGDDENVLRKNKMKGLDQTFQDAIIEAAQAHNAYVLDKLKNDAIVSKKYLTKPPKFVRIKFNKPYGNVKNMELAANTMTPCECDPTNPNPCGPGSDCLNRMLMFECQPQLCPAGDKCNNQRFTKTLYPPMVPFLTPTRGWGLKTLEDIKEGSFVIEYVGDVIDEEEYQRRCLEMHQRNEQNYYFLTIDNSRMIDAGPKGNLSRFMNHSCEPNCVTQKWTVNGDTRIGLFALHDIPRGSELVFDYRLQSCSGVEKKPCQCGATRCSKFIGVKVEEEKKKIIPVNDVEKCKGTSKNKRKPLKLKDNVSDSEKSKLSKVSKNDQNISTIENGGIETEDDKIDDSKKLKAKTSIRKSSTVLKNENSKSTETQVSVRKRFRNSTRINTNMTKDSDNNANPLESEQTTTESKRKLKKTLSRFSSIKDDTSDTDDSVMMKRKRQGKHLKKKNVIKTDLFTKPKHSTDLSKATALCSPEERGRVVAAGLKTPANMKTRISKRFTQDLTKTEQIHDVLENANAIKPNKPTVTQEKSRHSLTRLAKSRHSVLSKNNNNNEEKKEQIIVSKRKFDKEKKKTAKISNAKKKRVEISSVKTIIAKKNKINKQSLMSKIYHQNDSCLICGKGHTELACKNKKCPRVFHLSCMNKTRIVKSGFICPSHFCFVCKKRKVVAKCKFCVKSFCTAHVKGNIFKDPLGNGMLCTTHHPNKKPMPLASALSTHHSLYNVCNKFNTADKNIEKPVDLASPNLVTAMPTEAVLDTVDDDELDLDVDDMTEEEYSLTRVVKDDCDREYIHIGGFNVCNMSDLVTDQIAEQTRPIDTDGDLFKPSSASVVIDIESASALYQPAEALELVSIATENKDNLDYANIQFIPDASQNKNKWLAAGP